MLLSSSFDIFLILEPFIQSSRQNAVRNSGYQNTSRANASGMSPQAFPHIDTIIQASPCIYLLHILSHKCHVKQYTRLRIPPPAKHIPVQTLSPNLVTPLLQNFIIVPISAYPSSLQLELHEALIDFDEEYLISLQRHLHSQIVPCMRYFRGLLICYCKTINFSSRHTMLSVYPHDSGVARCPSAVSSSPSVHGTPDRRVKIGLWDTWCITRHEAQNMQHRDIKANIAKYINPRYITL